MHCIAFYICIDVYPCSLYDQRRLKGWGHPTKSTWRAFQCNLIHIRLFAISVSSSLSCFISSYHNLHNSNEQTGWSRVYGCCACSADVSLQNSSFGPVSGLFRPQHWLGRRSKQRKVNSDNSGERERLALRALLTWQKWREEAMFATKIYSCLFMHAISTFSQFLSTLFLLHRY